MAISSATSSSPHHLGDAAGSQPAPGKVIIHSGDDGGVMMTLRGGSNNDWFGYALAVVHDLNGDTFKELLVGAPRDGWGMAYLFFGPFDNIGVSELNIDDADMPFMSASPTDADFGFRVGHVHDLNGDGVTDLRIAARRANGQGGTSIVTYFYSGDDWMPLFSILGDDPFDPWAIIDGDADGDGDVDNDDFAIVMANQGLSGNLTRFDGDFNGDGIVNGDDLIILQASMGTTQFGFFQLGQGGAPALGIPCPNGHWIVDCDCTLICAPLWQGHCLPPQECGVPQCPGPGCGVTILNWQPLYDVTAYEIVLTASGTPHGGTYKWAILSGADLINVLSPEFPVGPTQRFEPLEAGVVRMRVMYQNSPCGSCVIDFNVNLGWVDTDSDGLPDAWETMLGLSPTNPDSDGDGIPDGMEDFDGDGLSNHDEWIHGTDPTNPDTDGDGTSDGQEVAQGSDPNDAADGGQPPQPDDILDVTLTVGDHSGSHSELWMLRVGKIRFKAPGHGEVTPPTVFRFLRGKSYEVRLVHLGSICVEPDYDYTATLAPAGGDCVFINDPQGLLGVVGVSGGCGSPPSPNPAKGKKAYLCLPGMLDSLAQSMPGEHHPSAARYVGDHDVVSTHLGGVPVGASVTWEITAGASLITGFSSVSIPSLAMYSYDATAGDQEGHVAVRATITFQSQTCARTHAFDIQRYARLEVRYRTFIECLLIPGPPVFASWDFYHGDNRGISYGATSYRSSQIITVSPSLEYQTGAVTASSLAFGMTHGYSRFDPVTGIEQITHGAPCASFAVSPSPPPGATGTELVTPDSLSITVERLMPSVTYYPNARDRYVIVRLHLNGTNPLETAAPVVPAINSDIDMHVYQSCNPFAGMEPVRYKLVGAHDGYPAHEVYLNANTTPVYTHFPSVTGEGPMSLFPPMEHSLSTDWTDVPP